MRKLRVVITGGALRDVVMGASLKDSVAIRKFAVEQALAIGAFDMPLRVRTEALWDQLHARGRSQSIKRDQPIRAGFGIAAGS